MSAKAWRTRVRSGLLLLTLFFLRGAASAEEEVELIVSDRTHRYERLSHAMWSTTTVRGPGRLRLLFRAGLPPALDGTVDYAIDLRVDGGPVERLSFSGVGRSRAVVFRDGRLGVPAQLRDRILNLGAGYHNVDVRIARSSAGMLPIFLRTQLEKKKRRPRRWVSLNPLDDAERVDLVVREQYVTYHRNQPGKGFSVEVIGPTQLRIFSRIENRPEMRGRIHYRLQIKEEGKVINTFRLNSRRSDIASYKTDETLVPGQAREIVIPVRSGLHRYEITPIDPDKDVLLARFMLPRSDLDLSTESDP